MARIPVILLAFANDREGNFLRSIAEEQRSIRRSLAPLVRKHLVQLEELPNATASDIFEAFRHFGDRIQVFHYGGHAQDLELLLHGSDQPLDVRGFAHFLAQQKGLQLVFMNGCATVNQQIPLQQAGIPWLILTDAPILDQAALHFASQFYLSLATGSEVRRCFAEAEGATTAQVGSNRRSLILGASEAAAAYGFPWHLFGAVHQPPFSLRISAPSALRWTIPLGLGLFLCLGMLWFFWPPPTTFSYSVKVQGDAHDPAIQSGEVVIDLGGQILRRKLDQDRMVRFQIPPAYDGEAARISFSHTQPYQAVWGDSVFILQKNRMIEMPVNLRGLDQIRGYLYDFQTELPLAGASALVRGIKATTDSSGWFTLEIPPALQQKNQSLHFQKTGYQPESLSHFPVYTQKEIRLPMTPLP